MLCVCLFSRCFFRLFLFIFVYFFPSIHEQKQSEVVFPEMPAQSDYSEGDEISEELEDEVILKHGK
jgi:hypothetical protein